MPAANDFTLLVDKIERRLGLTIIGKRFPEQFNKDSWVDVIKKDTLPTFSRYFPRKLKFVVNDETCNKNS